MTITNEQRAEAQEILEHKSVLPKTTAQRLGRSLRTGNVAELTKYLRLAHLHDAKLEQSRKETAELEAMIAQEAAEDATIQEMIDFDELTDRCKQLRLHPEAFLQPGVAGMDKEVEDHFGGLDGVIATGDMKTLKAWVTTHDILLERVTKRSAAMEPLYASCVRLVQELAELKAFVHPAKQEKFQTFLDKLSSYLNTGSLEELQEWHRDATQRELQLRTRRPRSLSAAA